ncbi:MAG TPA: glycosyltransferase family 1 protein, partial [Gammaproteobacteria bacterium]|nr:glycosyltransferase family 1 protein [Gammaproteobacteria bacterium]
ITVTNHNNARSCWELQEKGHDVLVAAEFTCHFDEYNLFVHVLTYGFTKKQEKILNEKRRNIYDFLRFAAENDIPVILPHPLYFYTRNDKIDLSLFEKLAVMFERFEVLNGQRDLWQSVLTLNWAQGLTPEKIKAYARKHNLNPFDFGVDPNKPKILTGGSDDHMGIFAGESGSSLYIPDLQKRLKTEKASELALEAIRSGHIAPYGHVTENQKLSIALLDYFAQIATRIEDPGLLRILFHRGEVSDKLACFTISNLLLEMRKRKNIQKFFNFVHDALQGKKPNKLVKWKISKDYRFCITHLEKIADSKNKSPEIFVDTVNRSVTGLFTELNKLIFKRVKKSLLKSNRKKLESFSTEELTRKFEIPSQLSALIFDNNKKQSDMSDFNIGQILEGLTFPVLISLVLTGATLASTRLLYQNRRFLNDFSDNIGKNSHPGRALYLTDTLRDKNGVSNSLSAKLVEIQKSDLPVDFLICHSDIKPELHLHVVKPLAKFTIPDFGEQELRIPDLLEIARIFYQGGYDRIICSTEGPMALVSLFIKHMFNVPSYFFMHTDWLDFIKFTTDLTHHERDRIRRALRVFYKQYSGVFVLNNEHRDWLTGHQMQLEPEKVFLTAHHSRQRDPDIRGVDKTELFIDANKNTPVLLLACRLSREKGVFELPEIIDRAKRSLPELKIVIAGSGPAREELQKILPEALFTGWVDKNRIAELYSGLDLFVFPSKFDTFGNVILESFAYGMPVVAYNCKGPKDIIEHGVNGYLVDNIEQMSDKIVQYFKSETHRKTFPDNAIRRSKDYQAEPIMQKFMLDMGLPCKSDDISQLSVA